MSEDSEEEGVVVPWTALSAPALAGVIDEFIAREGTDYGELKVSHEEKRAQVLAQLKAGSAEIRFDPKTKTTTLASR